MPEPPVADRPVRGTVADIRSRFIVTYPLDDHGELTTDRSVTFTPDQWKGKKDDLYQGAVVNLHGVTLSAKGWRAREAHPVTPQSNK